MRRAMEMSMLEGAAGSSTYTLENFGSGNNSAVNDDIASMLGDEDEAKAIALSLGTPSTQVSLNILSTSHLEPALQVSMLSYV